jgi:UDP-N-acetylglucosamine transferase subunit ALG13
MMLLITGTEIHPFDRLIEEIDRLAAANKLPEPMFVQLGHTKIEPAHCEFQRFISFGEMCRRIESSSLVISHAGAGSTLLCLQCGKRPIIVPRQKKHREHVDDHQILFAERLADFDLVRSVVEMSDLLRAIEEEWSRGLAEKREWHPKELVAYLEGLLGTWNLRR